MRTSDGVRRVIVTLLLFGSLLVANHGAGAADTSLRAEFGFVPGHFGLNEQGFRGKFLPDSGFGGGIYAVPIDADSLLAFDIDSATTARCSRIDTHPLTFSFDTRRYYRVRCKAPWNARSVLFVDAGRLRPLRGERLEWQAVRADPGGLRGRSGPHHYSAVARPRLMRGLALVTSATFSGLYLPSREFDELRGDSITFGHYTVRDRRLQVARSIENPTQTWFEARDSVAVVSGLEWAFLPEDASQKSGARFIALYETPQGYVLMLRSSRDHEGAGVDEVVELFASEGGRWRMVASAERTQMY